MAEMGSPFEVPRSKFVYSCSVCPFAGCSPELPDRVCTLVSFEPVVFSFRPPVRGLDDPRWLCVGVRLVPLGVSSLRAGMGRRGTATPAFASVGSMGRALGDGGIARPGSRGPRAALGPLLPGMGGRNRGAADDMAGALG